jgi:hypothetical protein
MNFLRTEHRKKTISRLDKAEPAIFKNPMNV